MSPAALLLAALLLCSRLGAQEGKEQAPSFSPDSIVNSANGNSASLAPNVLATVYGLNLAYSTETATLGVGAGNLPTELGKVHLYVGGIAAPLLYASPTQINFLIPASLRAGRTTLGIQRQATTTHVEITLLEVAPALFVVEGGKLAATHVDGKLITADSPALPGEIIVAWGDGLGQTDPRQVDGAVPRAASPIVLLDRFRVVLGEQLLPSTSVLYAGLAPGYPGLYQINLRLPAIIPTKQPNLRIGFEEQMSQSGLALEVAPNAP